LSSAIITTSEPIAMNVKARLLSTASIVRSSKGNRIRNDPRMNASFTVSCVVDPTGYHV